MPATAEPSIFAAEDFQSLVELEQSKGVFFVSGSRVGQLNSTPESLLTVLAVACS
jgi:hypothetical protein